MFIWYTVYKRRKKIIPQDLTGGKKLVFSLFLMLVTSEPVPQQCCSVLPLPLVGLTQQLKPQQRWNPRMSAVGHHGFLPYSKCCFSCACKSGFFLSAETKSSFLKLALYKGHVMIYTVECVLISCYLKHVICSIDMLKKRIPVAK